MSADHDNDSAPIPLGPSTVDSINEAFARGRLRMRAIEDELKGVKGELQTNTDLTREMHEVWMFAKSGILAVARCGRGLARFGGWIRTAFKWLTPIAIGVVALYHAAQTLLHLGPKP